MSYIKYDVFVQQFLSVSEAARLAKTSRQWILKLCADGRVAGARKVGRRWEIPPGALISPSSSRLGKPFTAFRIPVKPVMEVEVGSSVP